MLIAFPFSSKLTGEMFFYKGNTFAIEWNYTDMPCDAFAMFGLDENGKAINIKNEGNLSKYRF